MSPSDRTAELMPNHSSTPAQHSPKAEHQSIAVAGGHFDKEQRPKASQTAYNGKQANGCAEHLTRLVRKVDQVEWFGHAIALAILA